MWDIRQFTFEDIAWINVLLKQLSENAPRVSKKDLINIVKKGGEICLARDPDSKKIIAIATLIVFDTLMGKMGRIEDVVVDDRHRGKGYGKKLVLSLIDKARERGLKQIDLTSSPKRVAANGLYQKLGFVKRETNVYRMVL